ncbi:MAG: hypothetical protein H6891_02935 [Brucellaceae bacterium]|nr:hypothetical protein [Brucellaceae bacterium]
MTNAGANSLVWDAETLSRYLEKPRDFVRGQPHVVPQQASAQDRADLILLAVTGPLPRLRPTIECACSRTA